jgi:hypothetical protein
VVHPVPDTGHGVRLLVVDPLREMHVEPEEVDQLARAIDLGLVGGLALTQHGSAIEQLPVPGSQELRGPQENGGPVLEPPVAPVPLSLDRCLHGRIDSLAVGLMHLGQHPLVAVRRHHVLSCAGAYFSATHDSWDVGPLGADGGERRLQGRSLRASRGVIQHRLVVGFGDVPGTAHHFTGGMWVRKKIIRTALPADAPGHPAVGVQVTGNRSASG